MARVFLSHSSRDNTAAAGLKAWLDAQGFATAFLDLDQHSGIPPGADWEKTLYQEIQRCQALLILQTPNWSASRWCFAEFAQARALGKPIFQVVETAQGAAEPPIAADLQRLDLCADRQTGLERLRRELERIALQDQGGFPWPPPGDPDRPPFPGLLVFEADDAAVFFGRDDDWRAVIERLNTRRVQGGPRLLVLQGSSGAGKSSLLRAGVLPRLERAGKPWLVLPTLRPRTRPLEGLAQTLAMALGRPGAWRELHQPLATAAPEAIGGLLSGWAADLCLAVGAPEAQLLLPIDQGEELFTVAEPRERERFLVVLATALRQPLPLQALMTIRSDAMASLQALPALLNTFETLPLGPLSLERYREIIEGPARVAGIQAEPAFVERAIHDTTTEDALPLLAFALRQLHDRRGTAGRLTLSDYLALGDAAEGLSPLENAVKQAADGVLRAQRPDAAALGALKQAFVPALVGVSPRGGYTRRAASWEALPPLARPMLEALVAARLLVRRQSEGEPSTVEVAHEALLRVWRLLRGWLDDDREFLIGCQQLEQDLHDWQRTAAADRPATLLSGLKLQRAKAWLAERPQQLSGAMRDFVRASAERADAQQRQARRNRRLVMGGLSALTALSVAGGAVAWWREGEARAAESATRAESLLASDPLGSMVHALAALGRQSEAEAFPTSQSLAAATARNAQITALFTGQGEVLSLIELPNGELISGGRDGSLRRWREGRPLGPSVSSGQGAVARLVALPNGELISGGTDGSLRRWRDGQALGGAIPTGQGAVTSLIALRNGELISGGADGSLRRWRDGRALGAEIPTGQGVVWSLLERRNGEWISGGDDGSLRRWRDGQAVGAPIPTNQGQVLSLVERSNGELVSGGDDGSLRRWRDGQALGAPLPTGQGAVWSLIERKTGELISGGSDGSLRRWRDGTAEGAAITTDQGWIWSLLERRNGEWISGGRDGSLRFWRAGQARDLTIPTGQGEVWSLIARRNGELISGGRDGSLRRWREGRAVGAPIATGHGWVLSVIERRNGELISGGTDGRLRRWREGRAVGAPIPTGQGWVMHLIELRNGEVISAGRDGSLRRWREGWAEAAPIPTGQGAIWSFIELPNGEWITGGGDGRLRRWREGQPAGTPIATGQGEVISLIALRDGELISGGTDGTLRRWRNGQPLGAPIPSGQSQMLRLLELQSGEVISAGRDGSLRLWRNGQPVGAAFPSGLGEVWSLIEGQTGEVIAGGRQGRLRTFLMPPTAIRAACQALRIHPVLVSPQTPVERAARRTCRRYGGLRG